MFEKWNELDLGKYDLVDIHEEGGESRSKNLGQIIHRAAAKNEESKQHYLLHVIHSDDEEEASRHVFQNLKHPRNDKIKILNLPNKGKNRLSVG